MSQYSPQPQQHSDGSLKIVLNLSNYTTKADLASIKIKEDNLDVDKLNNVPADLSKLSNVVHNDVKKNVYDNLLPKSMILILRSKH